MRLCMAAVIGYPSRDVRDDLIEQIGIFRNRFDIKRLQPGRLKGTGAADSFGHTVQSLTHDCTTLGNNSGSALIDVETAQVVGVHFGGQPLLANHAVPSWELSKNNQVRDHGVEFV